MYTSNRNTSSQLRFSFPPGALGSTHGLSFPMSSYVSSGPKSTLIIINGADATQDCARKPLNPQTPKSSISSARTSIMSLRVIIPWTLETDNSPSGEATSAKAESVPRIAATTFHTESSGNTTT